MSNSTTNLDTISTAQSAKEVTANDLFDALSPSSVFGRRASTTAGLTWGYYGGVVSVGGVLEQLINGTVTLTNNATNYLEFDDTASPTGVIKNTSAWTGAIKLYKIVVASGAVVSYEDWRTAATVSGTPATIAADVTIADAGAYYSGTDVEAALQEIGAELAASPFDMTTFFPGTTTASAKLLRVPVARAVSFANDFAGSYGRASAAATGSTAFDIQVNGSSVGTATFAAAASTATFVTAGGALALVAGDVLMIVAPVTPDATLADIGIVLAGTR